MLIYIHIYIYVISLPYRSVGALLAGPRRQLRGRAERDSGGQGLRAGLYSDGPTQGPVRTHIDKDRNNVCMYLGRYVCIYIYICMLVFDGPLSLL